MSVDTKELREWVRHCGITSWVEKVERMCDEIDRLREQINEQEFAAKKLEVENALLKDRQRPRSIKDEPPPPNTRVLAFMEAWNPAIFGKHEIDEDYTHWLPMPPAPPQPDAFEVWWEHVFLPNDYQLDSKARIRMAWDAAIKSTKAKP